MHLKPLLRELKFCEIKFMHTNNKQRFYCSAIFEIKLIIHRCSKSIENTKIGFGCQHCEIDQILMMALKNGEKI